MVHQIYHNKVGLEDDQRNEEIEFDPAGGMSLHLGIYRIQGVQGVDFVYQHKVRSSVMD